MKTHIKNQMLLLHPKHISVLQAGSSPENQEILIVLHDL